MINEYNQTDVAYGSDGDGEVRDRPKGKDKQFPGNKMPQGNKMQKHSDTHGAHHRHKEYR